VTPLALALVLSASFIHATWNLLAKQVRGGAAFVWLAAVISSVIYAPLVALLLFYRPIEWTPLQIIVMIINGLLHAGYFLVLQRGYRVGDLSLVYPLARGTGPMLSLIGAVLLFGERPTPVAIGGALLVIAGVFIICTGPASHADPRRLRAGIAYGFYTGAFIAAYTLFAKPAMAAPLLIPPLLLDYSSHIVRVAALWPLARRRWGEVRKHWFRDRWRTVIVALLNPISFILVLMALQIAPVSYVAPAREISILIGVVLGARILTEGAMMRRLVAGVMMLLGLGALALG
jgi:drug/metabolite transporter (DMT)-like permease